MDMDMRRTSWRQLLPLMAIGLALSLAPGVTSAETGPVLKVCTDLEGEETALFYDIEDLQALGSERITTSTIWTEGQIEFEGVPLARLVEELDIASGSLELTAANDYFVEISVEEAREDNGLIAYHMDGALMSTRDKGPLWLVFPFDADTKYQSETYYSKSIWQISSIKVLPQ